MHGRWGNEFSLVQVTPRVTVNGVARGDKQADRGLVASW